MKRLLFFVAALVLSLGGLATGPAQAQSSVRSGRQVDYRLRPMDLMKIQVFDQPDLEREVRVSQNYTVVLPLIGAVDVRNRSLRDAETLITDAYRKDFLVNPQINVMIVEYAQRSVNVFGAVNTPGAVPIPPEARFSLLDAVAKAGGFSRMANRSRLSLTRTSADGQPQNYSIDANQLMTGDSANRWLVQDGDVIYVPERVL